MYIPGRLRTASRPFRTLIESEPYSELGRGCFSGSGASVSATSDPHRHDDVLEVLLGRVGNQRAGGRVAEGALDLGAGHVVQDVEQVVDVETDIEGVARI